MKHRVARRASRPLADWENQIIQYAGAYADRRESTKAPGTFMVAFQNVRIRPYWSTRTSPERYVDHVWITGIPPEGLRGMERLDWYTGIGEIKRYTRSDGTVDFTIREITALNIEKTLDAMINRIKSERVYLEERVALLDICLDAMRRRQAMIPWETSMEQYYKSLQDYKEGFINELKGMERSRRMAESQRKFPLTADPRIPGKSLKPAGGFACAKR